MLFTVDRGTVRWIQKTLSRARKAGDWSRVFHREGCWTPGIFLALSDEFDRLVLEASPQDAARISSQMPLLADRIRPELAGGLTGSRSLKVWALAIQGSGLRATGKLTEAGHAFAAASELARKGILQLAEAELAKRYAYYLFHLRDRQALVVINRALELAEGEEEDLRAEILNLQGVCRAEFEADLCTSIRDFGHALALCDPKRGARSARVFQSALQNMAAQLVRGDTWNFAALVDAKRLLLLSKTYLGKGLDVRKFRSLWIEGLLFYRLGFNRHGERLLERARAGLLKFDRNLEYAVVTLDLIVMLLGDGFRAEAEGLLEDLRNTLRGRLDQETHLLIGHLDLAHIEMLHALRARISTLRVDQGALSC